MKCLGSHFHVIYLLISLLASTAGVSSTLNLKTLRDQETTHSYIWINYQAPLSWRRHVNPTLIPLLSFFLSSSVSSNIPTLQCVTVQLMLLGETCFEFNMLKLNRGIFTHQPLDYGPSMLTSQLFFLFRNMTFYFPSGTIIKSYCSKRCVMRNYLRKYALTSHRRFLT